AVVTERIKALNQFKEALRYGYTRDGLLKNMDTGEVLAFADQGPTFLVRETIGSVQMSVETSVQVLVDYYSRTITLDPLNRAYGKALQDAIQEGLNERIRQVWRWAVVNTSRLPPRNQGMISRFFSTLNAFALAMTTQVRLCLADCSACDRACLRLYNHLEDTHLCIDHQHVDHVHYATHKHTEQGSYGSTIERPVDDIATISPMKAELVSEDTALEVDSCQASLRLGHQITLTYLRNVLAIIQEESLSHDHVDDAAASHFFAAVVFEVLASKRGATWEQSGQVDRSRVEVKDSPAQYKRIMDRVAILNAQADISVL
ncbi:hypothetical protein FRC09_002999, partial [Ceratobasidium sp. 395]